MYTDGACSGNPGPGGWGWVIPDQAYANGFEADSTNQRMELMATLDALRTIEDDVTVYSDSTYVVNCFRDGWWKGWLQRDWKNKAKKPVANRDIWEPLIELYRERTAKDPKAVQFVWVKGHSGNKWNDVADRLAVEAAHSQRARSGTGLPGELGPEDAPSRSKASGSSSGSSPVPAQPDPTGRAAPAGHLVVVTGHRPPDIGGYDRPNPTADKLLRRLGDILEAKAQMHTDLTVITGLQLGSEQLGAEAAIATGLPFVAVLAFPDPSAVWPKKAQERFDELLDAAADVIVLQDKVPDSKPKIAASLKRRDAWMSRNAQEAVVIWDRKDGGIGTAVKALETGLGDDVWVLDPSEV